MHNTLGFVEIIFLTEKECAELNFPRYFLGLRLLKSDELLRSMKYLSEFIMVLLRVRLGLFTKDLADRFRVSVSTVSSVCRTWIMFMRKELEPICIQWPSKEQILYYMPPVIKSFYPDLVSIIDCTELQMESPSSSDKRSLCYSSYI
ncbi:hypothetical protein P5673_030147 [Acropora cervicornis]|uniref:Transposase Helix-turn-helix domain-containing protein n=1 Tax=Acropora cervicornis TaxID=6130 RepID=A0AAD9PUT1_ACRCE|nr:hypothetical protein P5673_030147 [Acropora cervicornis]